MKSFLPILAFPFFVACAEEPQPEPDPLALEQLVAQMEAEPVAAGLAVPKDEEKDEVDRIANSLQKMDVERVDPALAEALIGR
jgi:hypothetical protein